MTYKLYYKGQFLSTHDDIEEARAQARWTYFEFQSTAWEGEHTPPGFFISIECVLKEAA